MNLVVLYFYRTILFMMNKLKASVKVLIFLIGFIILFVIINSYDLCLRPFSITHEKLHTVSDYLPIKFISNCASKCDVTYEYYDIVFLVNTFIKNLDKRNAIRETWGYENRTDNYKFKTVFMMGIDYNNNKILEEILKENEIYKDIVVGEFQDVYRNNSIKCIVALNWAKDYCYNSRFYIIADDDAYFNNINLMNYLNKVSTRDIYSITKLKYFGGAAIINARPFKDGKFAVSKEEYPRDVYPPYVNGHAMVMSKDILLEFIKAVKYTMFFWIDDVYFGLLAETAGIKVDNMPHSTLFHPGDNVNLFDQITTSHYMPNANKLKTIWNEQKKRGHA